MSKPYELAIIPCSSSKNPTGMTPATLYKGTPFALMMKHAGQRTDHIIIMSAKYGLLELSDRVCYYDTYLPDLKPGEREALRERIALQAERYANIIRIISYLPAAYFQLFAEAAPELKGHCVRPFAGIRSMTAYARLAHEIKAGV